LEPLPIPTGLAGRFAGWTVDLASSYGSQTATWRLRRGDETRYLKVAVPGWYPSVSHERERMRWAGSRLPVPRVIDGGTTEGVDWLLTAALPGLPATDEGLTADPPSLVPLLARGLRDLHETRAEDCPFDFGLDAALAHVRDRVTNGLVEPGRDFHPEHSHLTASEALAELRSRRPAAEDLVLCHGDYCLPNILIVDGQVSGYVDLGELGVADRWWDLAVATWSLTWNLGPGWEDLFLESYGAAADRERTAYFRLLYDLVS
jgi:kanamycin kinase